MVRWLIAVVSFTVVSFFLASPGAAQSVTGTGHSSSDAVLDVVTIGAAAQGRIGDRGGLDDTELGLGETTDPLHFTGQFDWVSGPPASYDWTLSYEREFFGGAVRFELGEFSYRIPTVTAFNSFFIRTWAELPNTIIRVDNLTLGPPPSAGGGGLPIWETATPTERASSEADGNAAQLDILKISAADLLDGFTLKGRVTMTFAGAVPEPEGEQLVFEIFAADDGNPPGIVDSDGDGVPDDEDNCTDVANPGQADGDSDGVGDVCDNCLEDFNPAVDGKQPNEDGDIFGDACDNCPLGCKPVTAGTCSIDDDANEDGDMWGDACDNCPTIPNDDQADSNDNGKGDVCDENVVFGNTFPPAGPAGAQGGGEPLGAVAAAAAQGVTTVELFIDCSTDVAFANIGINLTNTGATFGDFANCQGAPGPNFNEQLCTFATPAELGPSISTASSVIGATSVPGTDITSVSFPWLAGDPIVSGDMPDDFAILQLHGKPSGEPGGLPGDLICQAQTVNTFLGVLRLVDLASGSNPLSKSGFSTFDPGDPHEPGLPQLVGPGAVAVPDEQVVFQVNPPGPSLITLQLRPTDDFPDTRYELSIKVDPDDPPQYVARLAFGLIASGSVGQADMQFGDCLDDDPLNTPPGFEDNLRGCAGGTPNLSSRVESTDFAPSGPPFVATYTVGPDDEASLIADGSNRLPNTLYVAVDSGFEEEGDDVLNSAGRDQRIGVVIFSEPADPPQITFDGTEELPGFEDGPVCDLDCAEFGDESQITDENVTLSNTSSSSSDTDGDGEPDDFDNCVRVPNPQQDNTGGVGFVTSADNFDRIGDVCTCGDPGRDGVSDNGSADVPEGASFTPQDDVAKCQDALSGQALAPGESSDFCKVTATEGDFTIVDILVLEAETAAPESSGLGDPKTGSLQSCGAAKGQL